MVLQITLMIAGFLIGFTMNQTASQSRRIDRLEGRVRDLESRK